MRKLVVVAGLVVVLLFAVTAASAQSPHPCASAPLPTDGHPDVCWRLVEPSPYPQPTLRRVDW